MPQEAVFNMFPEKMFNMSLKECSIRRRRSVQYIPGESVQYDPGKSSACVEYVSGRSVHNVPGGSVHNVPGGNVHYVSETVFSMSLGVVFIMKSVCCRRECSEFKMSLVSIYLILGGFYSLRT